MKTLKSAKSVNAVKSVKSVKSVAKVAVKPTAKGVAKTVARVAKSTAVKKIATAPKVAATKTGTDVSKAEIVLNAVVAAFADKSNESPRDTVIKMCKAELGMKNTTAATYYSNAMRKLLTAEHNDALALLDRNKPVWSAFKANKQGVVTSAALFTSASSANTFNDMYRHSGVTKGVVDVNDVVAVKKTRKTA